MLLAIIFSVLTTLVLITGLISLAIGKNFNKKYGTKLMALRIIMQAITLISIAAGYYLFYII